MFGWLFASNNSGLVGGIGLLVTVLGFALTAWALRLTYVQAKEAKRAADSAQSAADASSQALEAFRFKIDRYTAYRDLAEAEFAMNACRQHLEGDPSWSHASNSYEVAHRALVRVRQAPDALPEDLRDKLTQIADHIRRFCDKVDAAMASKSTYPNPAKVGSAIRLNYETIAAAKSYLERELG